MQFGISVYPGLDNTAAENLYLIKLAAAQGVTRLFTSFHIPETNISALKNEISDLFALAKHLHLEIISDISPETMKLLNLPAFKLSAFHILGINTLRLDYGYGADEIAHLSRNRLGMRIQLNASTVTPRILNDLILAKANFENIDALHNFYPREGTGISEETLVRKTAMLHKLGIKVGAFIPSQNRRRSPLRAGLPTLEMHREASVSLAARHLAAIGMDSVFISDSLPAEKELSDLTTVVPDCVTLQAKFLTANKKIQDILSNNTFTSRIDEARDAIRSQESRTIIKEAGLIIPPEKNITRLYGSVTIDNEKYARYMGELQVLKRPQPADERVNVVAQVHPDECFLTNYIIPGKKFRFIF